MCTNWYVSGPAPDALPEATQTPEDSQLAPASNGPLAETATSPGPDSRSTPAAVPLLPVSANSISIQNSAISVPPLDGIAEILALAPVQLPLTPNVVQVDIQTPASSLQLPLSTPAGAIPSVAAAPQQAPPNSEAALSNSNVLPASPPDPESGLATPLPQLVQGSPPGASAWAPTSVQTNPSTSPNLDQPPPILLVPPSVLPEPSPSLPPGTIVSQGIFLHTVNHI